MDEINNIESISSILNKLQKYFDDPELCLKKNDDDDDLRDAVRLFKIMTFKLRDSTNRNDLQMNEGIPSIMQFFTNLWNLKLKVMLDNDSDSDNDGDGEVYELLNHVIRTLSNSVVDSNSNRLKVLNSVQVRDSFFNSLSFEFMNLKRTKASYYCHLTSGLHFMTNFIIDFPDGVLYLRDLKSSDVSLFDILFEFYNHDDEDDELNWGGLVTDILDELIDVEEMPYGYINCEILIIFTKYILRNLHNGDIEDLEEYVRLLLKLSMSKYDKSKSMKQLIETSKEILNHPKITKLEGEGYDSFFTLLFSSFLNFSYDYKLKDEDDVVELSWIESNSIPLKAFCMINLANQITSQEKRTNVIKALNEYSSDWLFKFLNIWSSIYNLESGSVCKYPMMQCIFILNKLIMDESTMIEFENSGLIQNVTSVLGMMLSDTIFTSMHRQILLLNLSFLNKFVSNHMNLKVKLNVTDELIEFIQISKVIKYDTDEFLTQLDLLAFSILQCILLEDGDGKKTSSTIEKLIGLSLEMKGDVNSIGNKPIEFNYLFEKFKTVGLLLAKPTDDVDYTIQPWFEFTFEQFVEIVENLKNQLSVPEIESQKRESIGLLINNFKFICGKVIDIGTNLKLINRCKEILSE